MTIKDLLRLNLGRILSLPEIKPLFRDLYFSVAKIYQDQIHGIRINGAWIRRSATTQDFIPAWSDIDLTLLIDDQKLSAFVLKDNLLVKDLQLVPLRFFDSWSKAGGLRNRQFRSWISLRQNSPTLKASPWNDREIIAFEIVHELYLLYFQLERKLHEVEGDWNSISIRKLKVEIERLHVFWDTHNPEWLLKPRSEILLNDEQFFQRLDQLNEKLTLAINPHFRTYSFDPLIQKQNEDCNFLNLQIGGRTVMTVPHLTSLPKIIEKYSDYFVCSETFLKLIKAVGVQEQTLLNQLARDKSSYYFHYNLQRLATDLLGAYLLYPDNQSVLYYCFRNIHEFTSEVAKTESPYWQTIEAKWTEEGRLPLQTHDLASLVKAYLDVLASLS